MLNDIWDTGTVTLTAGSTAFTTSNPIPADFRPGDVLYQSGLTQIIATINEPGRTSGTLLDPSPIAGTSAIRLRYAGDLTRATGLASKLIEKLGVGVLAGYMDLTGEADKLVYLTGASSAELVNFKAWARAFIGAADTTAARAALGAQGELGYTPVNKAGDTMTGALTANGFVSTSANAYRQTFANKGAFWRFDGATLYLMITADGDPTGGWNTLRPFYVNAATGDISTSHAMNIANGAYITNGGVNVSGNKGIDLGSVAVASPTDVARHLNLFGGIFGLSVSDSAQNYVVSTISTHKFWLGGTVAGYINSVGITSALHFYAGGGASMFGADGNISGAAWTALGGNSLATTSIDNRITSRIPAVVAALDVGAVGDRMMLYNTVSETITAGTTRNGSQLQSANAGGGGGAAQTGTWSLRGYSTGTSAATRVSEWLRIA